MNIAEKALQVIRDGNNAFMFSYPAGMLRLDRMKYAEKMQKEQPWRNIIGLRWVGKNTIKEPGDDFCFHDDAA